jgi:hypothetical protein
MGIEDIKYKVNRGYTMSIYGTRQAIHEDMLKDISFLIEQNKQLILSVVNNRRELLIDFYSNQLGGMNDVNKCAIYREVENYLSINFS